MENIVNSMILPIKIKSRNELDKFHWAKKLRLKQEYCLLIRNQMRLKEHPIIQEPTICKLNIISTRKRLVDYDNLVGGCKQLIDALADEGFIWDDCPRFLHLSIEQTKGDEATFIKRIVLC